MNDYEKIEGEDKTVKEELTSQIATIGENMNIRRFEKLESDGVIVSYIHAGGKIGVLVEADAPKNDAAEEALKNVAMQVAALNAKFFPLKLVWSLKLSPYSNDIGLPSISNVQAVEAEK